jgi:Asp-tRNA(Asn)/Glu-tRNA(Gln) amidotransferase A subunit family amidase
LPVGLEFAASSGRDRALLSLGLALEPVLGPIPAPLPPELENREAAKDRIKDVMDH